MPTLLANDAGAEIYYEDSGVPNGSTDYTTIVMIHGFVFTCGTFRPMLAQAAAYNLRLIALNLRDYPYSTPLTPSELEDLSSVDVAMQEASARAQGLEIATFLRNLVVSEKLPTVRVREGKRVGGVALLSWSLGNIYSLGMFGNEGYFDKETKAVLEQSMRTFIIFESAYYPFGLPFPDELYFPGRDPSLTTPDAVTAAFARWATAFWEPVAEIPEDVHALAKRRMLHELSSDPNLVPSTDRLTLSELAAIADPGVLGRSGRSLFTTDLKVWGDNAERALFDYDTAGPLRHVDVVVLWCDMGVNSSTYTVGHIARRFREAEERRDGREARKAQILKIQRANHMVHWHEPERFIQILVQALSRTESLRRGLKSQL